jgi:hypothetical protein
VLADGNLAARAAPGSTARVIVLAADAQPAAHDSGRRPG